MSQAGVSCAKCMCFEKTQNIEKFRFETVFIWKKKIITPLVCNKRIGLFCSHEVALPKFS
jgi:hypothetical protein